MPVSGPSWNEATYDSQNDASLSLGFATDAEVTGDGSVIAVLKRLRTLLASVPVTGTFWQATQPVSGTFWQTTQPVSGTFWQTTQPISGTVTANAGTGTLAVSGPLTDTQLRATPVPVSGTVTANAGTGTLAVSGPLTDAQLRATAVPVSGTVTANPATAAGKTLTYVSVAQGAAGTTTLAAASVGNKHKILGAVLTMSAAGTLKFTDGVGDLTGAMDIAANGGFVLSTSILPYQETGATNRALNLVTTVGLGKGVVIIVTEP